jgi:ABC-type multidrug transport system fused ATPase/permease subunit
MCSKPSTLIRCAGLRISPSAAWHRTTIAVAHRLSTIQKADLICVLDHGRLVETSGTHAELMARRGGYFEMVQLQSLEESSRSPGEA